MLLLPPPAGDDEAMMTIARTVGVFIVDDQEPFRAAARMAVELTDGFEVAGEAASGEEAVERFSSISPDLVLMDVQMPGIDGLEATRRIVGIDPGARVVVLSTYSADEFEEAALQSGALAFISKSDFTPDALAEAWAAAD